MDAISNQVSSQVSKKFGDSLLGYLGTLGDDAYRRNANLREFRDHIESLPLTIAQIQKIRDTSEDPAAAEWLKRVAAVYEKVDRLHLPVTGIVQFLHTSGSVKDVNSTLSKLLDDAKAVQAAALPSSSKTEEERWKRGWDSSKPSVRFGGEAVVNDVVDALICGVYPWVAMSGMGGIGKTYTAREVFNDERIVERFTGGTFWVTVSKDKPPIFIILKALCEEICPGATLPDFPRDSKDAVARVKSLLVGSSDVLFVLDDVWHADIVKIFDDVLDKGQGVILVTTRDQGNIRGVADIAKIMPIAVLSEEDSWKLFSWHAFRRRVNETPGLDDVARDVAKECKGLPLALRVIGATMREIQILPHERRRGKTEQSEWAKVLVKLQKARCYEDDYKELFRKLQLSVDNLFVEDSRLFHCFCYFAAYPEDKGIEGDDLVSLWIAEGIIKRGEGSLLSQREDARSLLDTLVRKSMVEWRDRDDSYSMHDILRDLARQNLEWDFLSEKEIPEAKRECLYAPFWMSPEISPRWTADSYLWQVCKEWIIPGTSDLLRAKRISLYGSSIENLPTTFHAPRLQLLVLSCSESLRVLPPGFFGHLSNLTVLDLSWTYVEEISAGVLGGLRKLRFLNLSNCTNLRKISSKIDDLLSLETVLLAGCHKLESLPRVGRLQNLSTFSATIRKCFNMECDDLYGWQRWFSYLTYRGLSRYVILELFQLHNLRRLMLHGDWWESRISTYVPDMSSLLALEELEIRNMIPVSLANLRNLKVLTLQTEDYLLDFPIPALDELPLLENLALHVSGMAVVPARFGSGTAFPSLKAFTLQSMKLRRIFTFCDGTMPHIESLSLSAGKLEEFPKSVRHLRTLRTLTIRCTSDKIATEVMELVQERGHFLRLEELAIYLPDPVENHFHVFFDLHLEALERLRVFLSNCPRDGLPQHIVDLEKQRNLQIVCKPTAPIVR